MADVIFLLTRCRMGSFSLALQTDWVYFTLKMRLNQAYWAKMSKKRRVKIVLECWKSPVFCQKYGKLCNIYKNQLKSSWNIFFLSITFFWKRLDFLRLIMYNYSIASLKQSRVDCFRTGIFPRKNMKKVLDFCKMTCYNTSVWNQGESSAHDAWTPNI